MLFTLSLAGALSLFLFYSYNTKSSALDLVSYTKTTWDNFTKWLFSTDDLEIEDRILNSGRTINQQHQTQTDTEAAQTQEYSQKPGFLKSTQILFSNLKEIASKLQFISINTLTRWPNDNKSHNIIEDIEVDAHRPGSNTWLQKFFASISSGLDSMSREINKLIGDEIKRSNFTTALLLSGANILSSFVRFFIQKTADTKKVASWEYHANNLRKNIANKTNESNESFDGTIATTRVDELYMNHNDYNSTLWQSAVGITFGTYSVIAAGIKLTLLLPLMAATVVRMIVCSIIDRVGTKLQDIHNKVDKNLQSYLDRQRTQKADRNNENINTLFTIHQRTYNKRVIIETFSAVTGKTFEQVMKWGLLRTLLSSLLKGKLAYTALIPTLMIMNSFSKSINVPASTNKSVNAFTNARNAIENEIDGKQLSLVRTTQVNDNDSPDQNTHPSLVKKLWKQTGIEGILAATRTLMKLDPADRNRIIAFIIIFFALQLAQCMFGLQSFELLSMFSQAISVHDRTASLHILKHMLYLDLAAELVRGIQRWLIRFTCSTWAQKLREKLAPEIMERDADNMNTGELVVTNIKALIDMSGELTNQYSLALMNIAITTYSIINCSFAPWVIIGAATIVSVKTLMLLCNDRESQQMNQARARDNIKQELVGENNMDQCISKYNKATAADYNGDYLTTNLSNFINALVDGLQNLGFSFLIMTNKMPKTDFSAVMGKSSSIFSGMDTINNNNFNVTKLAVAEKRLNNILNPSPGAQ